MSRPSSDKKFQSLLKNQVDASEVISKISGPNAFCWSIASYFDYEVPVYIDNCDPEKFPNMLWTLRSDGTLRSCDIYCLSTPQNTPGSYLILEECIDTVPKDTTIWELRDGLIMNPASGLVVTAVSGSKKTYLSLESNTFSSFQTWRVNNNTHPSLVTIIGMNSLCLQVTGNAVWVEACHEAKLGQQWYTYPDGTIRPLQNQSECLTYNIDKLVVTMTCGHEPSRERWLFTQSGTILNEKDKVVIDVKSSRPSLKEIIVYRANGGANQRWRTLDFPI
ncbi:Beta-galactoside-specific lectin 3 [Euphorbia peplus]|nr:Beta-galactoside-specific lectin 3 [Euphorbia peplus]